MSSFLQEIVTLDRFRNSHQIPNLDSNVRQAVQSLHEEFGSDMNISVDPLPVKFHS